LKPALLFLAAALALAGCATREGTPPSGAGFDPDSIPDAYAHPTAALMWPGATRAVQVTPAGDLYNGEWTLGIEPAADSAAAGRPRVVAFENRWLPVAHWTRHSGDVRWTFEAAPFPGPGMRDSGLVVSLLVRAVNHGAAPHSARLDLTLRPPEPHPVFVAFDARDAGAPALRWGSGAGPDTVHAWAEGAAVGPAWHARWELAAGASREVRVLMPAYPAPARDLRAAAATAHAERAQAVRRYWRETLAQGTRFELGNPGVEAALSAARVLMLSCRERRGSGWVPIGGPFHYRDVWLRDGARLAAALAVTGHTREARELASGLARFQWASGAFLSQRGQPDGTGQALWAFEQTLLRPAADDSVARFADAARRAWGWYEWQRGIGRGAGWRFGLMMPFGDPKDGELARAQLVGTDAWAIAGYRATARLLRAAGREAEAREVERTLEAYRADFAATLDRMRSRDVPPSWQETGRDWGNLAVAWPCGALPAKDPRLAAMGRRVWATAGGAGLVSYGSRDSLHDYAGADLGTWALLAGQRAQADSVLTALLEWRNASGAAAEMFSRDGDFGRNLPPHPTGAAALVALVRNSLIYDDGDTLELTLGAREPWWRAARIRRAPTRWGLVDLEFRRRGHAAEWRWSPVPVWTALTLPPGTRVARPPAAPLVATASGERVLAPPGTGEARIELSAIAAPP
jgi:hypothetical protein